MAIMLIKYELYEKKILKNIKKRKRMAFFLHFFGKLSL